MRCHWTRGQAAAFGTDLPDVSLQFQTRHAQRQATFGAIWATICLPIATLLTFPGTLGTRAIAAVLTAALTGLIGFLVVRFGLASRGLHLGDDGLVTGKTLGLRRTFPLAPGTTYRDLFDTREENPGVLLTARNAEAKLRSVPGMIHIPRGALLAKAIAMPNELLVRDPHGPTDAQRTWRPTGVIWRDDREQELIDGLVAVLEGRPVPQQLVMLVEPIHLAQGDLELRTRDATRFRFQRFPNIVTPFPVVLALGGIILLQLVPLLGLIAMSGAGYGMWKLSRPRDRHVRLAATGVRSSRTDPLVRPAPRLELIALEHGGGVIADLADPAAQAAFEGLFSYSPGAPGNVLQVRYPDSTDARLRQWHPAGVEWGSDGAEVLMYVRTALDHLRAWHHAGGAPWIAGAVPGVLQQPTPESTPPTQWPGQGHEGPGEGWAPQPG